MKKAQVTLFVVIAIMLVAVVAIALSMRGKMPKEATPAIMPIGAYVENCIKSTGADALVLIGQQGGYYELPSYAIDSRAYFYYEGKDIMPTKAEIEKEITKYINKELSSCTGDFADFPDFSIKSKDVRAKAIILESKVRLTVRYPLTITKGDSTYTLSMFTVEIPSRLYTLYAVSESIVEDQFDTPKGICLGCLAESSMENDLYFNLEDPEKDTIIFKITDKEVMLENKPYEFVFANKF